MNPTVAALRTGLVRGLIELRQSLTGAELLGHLLWPLITLVTIWFLRDRTVGGFALGGLVLPGVMGTFVALGMLLTVQYLAADREDGTLLRAKATPLGMRGYLTGKLVTISGTVLAYLVILLAAGAPIVGGVGLDRPGAWLTMAWVLVLGLVATQSIGAVLGSMVSGARGAGYVSLPVMGLIAISGVFYPITVQPGWLRAIAQVFPVYWLGLGMRAALLPAEAAAVELGGSWRLAETAAVLGAWALAGLLLAPPILRRMARRESGSALAARRDTALRRTT
jgi:ABC-2 type transport system permease protein